ncbi:MAG: NAD(P)/FAD-dependent oxidoreductase [Myxococcales bacterium]|nr:NAD(P)/FAD-dependent oxidoreductase [Myxococcales bacterium]
MRIAIVGAGPGGSTAALSLARQKRHEVVLIDRDVFPRVKTCGSALSPRCITLSQELGLSSVMEKQAYWIRGLRFTGPSGREATLSGKEGAWIIPRARFDAEIAFTAERTGARFEQGFKAIKALKDPSGRVRGISDGKREIEADLTIFADGAHSRFSEDKRPKRQIATIMGWWEGIPHLAGHMEMWFSKRVSPWYGWLFPENATRVNIGICYDPADAADPKTILQEIIDRHVGPERMKGAEMVACECSTTIKYRGAPIVYTEEVGPVAAPGALWIGEAARLTNAATGEGIYHAMKSGAIAADVIAQNLNGTLGQVYEQAIRRHFTFRLRMALGFLKFAGSPAFSAVTSLLAYRPVEKTLQWALAHV